MIPLQVSLYTSWRDTDRHERLSSSTGLTAGKATANAASSARSSFRQSINRSGKQPRKSGFIIWNLVWFFRAWELFLRFYCLTFHRFFFIYFYWLMYPDSHWQIFFSDSHHSDEYESEEDILEPFHEEKHKCRYLLVYLLHLYETTEQSIEDRALVIAQAQVRVNVILVVLKTLVFCRIFLLK